VQPRLLLIDNYDSFTYNLVQAFLGLAPTCWSIVRQISVAQALN
jgi:anthranilate/para-aminobenzoate synthase component II